MAGPNFDALDESTLAGDGGDVYLLRWLCETEQYLKQASAEEIKPRQADLEAGLIKVVSAPEPYPPPGRPIRNLVARCLAAIYSQGETRTLYDTLQSFLKILSDSKSLEKDAQKTSALYCVGELMGKFGNQVMSLMGEVTATSLRFYRASSLSPLLRYNALVSLRKALATAKRAVPDSVARDIIKQARSALNDRFLAIQRAACEILVVMYPSDDPLRTASEVESILSLCTKALEGADQITRRSHALLVGHMLASTQVERVVQMPESTKKGKKDGANDDGEDSLASTTAAELTKTIYTPTEMLAQLSSQYNRPQATRKTRIGIFDFYAALFTSLGASFAEANYTVIVGHLMTEIVGHPRNTTTRFERVLSRKLVGIIMRDLIGVRMLSEQGQITAIQELASAYLKRWPALMPGQSAPNPQTLSIALAEVSALLQQLGSAPPLVQDALAEPLITLLGHPNHTTRIHAAWALRCFCYSIPSRLAKAVLNVMEMLQRDMSSLMTPGIASDVHLRALGHAYGLAALVAVIPERPLYVSYDITAKILDVAIQLLKRAGEHELRIAGVEVEVAWTLIASLMTLGPNFVRSHLPQLLVLWRNALPKPTSKDTSGALARPITEWMFLLHVRESAMGAILSFLRYNSPSLVTLDVARRIASLLSNSLSFANSFISQNIVDENAEQQAPGTLTLNTREALLRRRIYQCFSILGFSGVTESTQSALLQSVVSLFASPDGYAGSSVQAAIASSAGTFSSIWQSTDGYAYGVTRIEVSESSGTSTGDQQAALGQKERLNRDTIENSVHELLSKPILPSSEHDTLSLCAARISTVDHRQLQTSPAATAVVDASIELFAQLFPLQDTQSALRVLQQLVESVRSPKLERNAGRKAAVFFNGMIALALALREAGNHRRSKDTLGGAQVTTVLSGFLKDAVVDSDPIIRAAASEAIGRLAGLAGTTFLTGQIKTLVDQVVNNRDPHGRAGCALAFGSIYEHVGGLAAGPLLKTTVNVLISLGNDPHPVVHYWALSALAQVIDAASLAYAPFVSSTLGMLLKIYTSSSHEPEGGSVHNANISGDLPAYQVVCRIIDAIITVLGPDMQETTRTQTLILDLVHELFSEEDDGIRVEAIKCIQHILMFAPDKVGIPELVQQFRGYLTSHRRPLKIASINALYQLVQRDALSMSKIGGDQLVENLFTMLDDDSSIDGVRNVITSWLRQTVVYNPSAWIDLCQRIMSRTTASQGNAASKGGAAQDDEGESLNFASAQESNAVGGRLTSRWRTQLFALQCLHLTCSIIAGSGRREHLDLPFARAQKISTKGLLVSRVPDIIKMAFTASAAHVTEIRLEGLIVLRDVIEIFAKAPDPDYEGALLLEQHQAPITAALTPAFSSDSTPEILASAVEACAVFVGSGVVKDVNRMGRILKLLTSALEQSKDSGTLSLGDAGELSPNASVMLRIATLSAWAELEIASGIQPYLKDVVKPYRATLAPLWIASLRDYASISADAELSMQDGALATLDSSNLSLGKDVLLPYYLDSWPGLLHAVSTAMAAKDLHILAAMDGLDTPDAAASGVRKEPTIFFFVVFGLAFEALANNSTESAAQASPARQTARIALGALKSLVRPEYSGRALLDSPIFDELIGLFYRMAMTESPGLQVDLVETLSVLVTSQASQLPVAEDGDDAFSSTLPQTQCLRLCSYILRHAIPSGRESILQKDADASAAQRITLVRVGFEAFSAIASTFGSARVEDLRGVAVALYSELLNDEISEVDLAGPTLQALKMVLDQPVKNPAAYGRLLHGFLSGCLLNIDSMRGREGPIPTKKVKNNLLASVLILTSIPPSVKIGRGPLEHCCFHISSKLADAGEMSLTAAHCARTLILAATSGNAVLRPCARMILPGTVEYIARVATLVDDGSPAEGYVMGVGEIWKAYSALLTSAPDENRGPLLGVFLPTIVLVLNPDAAPSALHSQGITLLLSFAASYAAAFKEATGKLDQATKETLETSIRQALGSKATTTGQSAKPKISLTAF